jgi:hypothetical protein
LACEVRSDCGERYAIMRCAGVCGDDAAQRARSVGTAETLGLLARAQPCGRDSASWLESVGRVDAAKLFLGHPTATHAARSPDSMASMKSK